MQILYVVDSGNIFNVNPSEKLSTRELKTIEDGIWGLMEVDENYIDDVSKGRCFVVDGQTKLMPEDKWRENIDAEVVL